jgi:hypothetical protein
MNEQELREMVRESIARHLGPEAGGTGTVRLPDAVRLKADTTHESGWSSHASHMRLPLVSGDDDGACLIEPSVRCNHCGYCLSLGH